MSVPFEVPARADLVRDPATRCRGGSVAEELVLYGRPGADVDAVGAAAADAVLDGVPGRRRQHPRPRSEVQVPLGHLHVDARVAAGGAERVADVLDVERVAVVAVGADTDGARLAALAGRVWGDDARGQDLDVVLGHVEVLDALAV